MKLTATSIFNVLAAGASKEISWQIYAKKTTSLSESLATGTWIELTNRVDWSSFPDINQGIEYQVGQFHSDSVDVRGHDVQWWKANIFNASASQYIELKISMTLAGASDTVPMFAGFVDKAGVIYNELENSVTFSAFTADELANRLIGENISTQYIEDDIEGNGTGTDGLILQNIIGMYVKDANITSYVLKNGTHRITYEYNGGSPQAKLNDGSFRALAAGDNTIGDAEVFTDDTMRLKVYVRALSDLPTSDSTIFEEIIVTNSGDTLPKQWYTNVSAQLLLKAIYSAIGITTVTFDTLQLNTYDSSVRLSYIDAPPNDTSVSGKKYSIAHDGTDIWTAVGNKLYKRTTTSADYTLKATLDTGYVVTKLLYNARNTHLWILCGPLANNGNGFLYRYNTTTDTLSSKVTLNAVADNVRGYCFELFDYEYSAGNFHYSIVYVDHSSGVDHGDVKEVDGSSLSVSTIFAGTALGYTGVNQILENHFMHQMASGKIRFKTLNAASTYRYHEIQLNGSNVWVDNGSFLASTPAYDVAAYSSSEGRIYYFDATNLEIKSHLDSSTSTTTIMSETEEVFTMYYSAVADVTYLCINLGHRLVSIVANTETILDAGKIGLHYHSLVYSGSALYGVADNGKLFQFAATLAMYVPYSSFNGLTVREALTKALTAFNLIGTISHAKKGLVYRRGNDSGTPQTTGNSLSLTVHEASQIEEVTLHAPKAGLVKVSNDRRTVTYDGTTFDSAVLSDTHVVEMNNSFIPDEILKDICYYMYQFFKTDRNLYRIACDGLPLFQYEPLDGASVTFTTTNIVKTASGPIYGLTYRKSGGMGVEVLL